MNWKERVDKKQIILGIFPTWNKIPMESAPESATGTFTNM